MINIKIFKNRSDEITGFETSGHAGYGDAGEDIICSAVSILVINTINAIEKFTSDKAAYTENQEQGIIKFSIKENVSNEASLLLNTMILGLEEMDKDKEYSKYIELIFEEV